MHRRRLGRFRLLKKLGDADLGVVWLAEDERQRERVVLRLLDDGSAADEARFLADVAAAARVRHSGLSSILEHGRIEEIPYISLAFIDGPTLDEARSLGLPVAERLRIARALADTVAVVHAAGLVHGSLRFHNILLERESREIKVLDLGIAKRVTAVGDIGIDLEGSSSRWTGEGEVLGAPAYMSPEQCRGEVLDARSDVFTFGTLLFELFSGKVPFGGANPWQVVGAVLRGTKIPFVPEEGTPPSVAALIARCHAPLSERATSLREIAALLGG